MPSASRAQTDRRAIAVLFAVFALMVQALIPAAALAGQPDAASILCTASGIHLAGSSEATSGSRKGFAGMPCQDCLAAAMAAVTPAPAVLIQAVVYQTARIDHAPAISLLAPRARAPPRPPGQGPPTA